MSRDEDQSVNVSLKLLSRKAVNLDFIQQLQRIQDIKIVVILSINLGISNI